MEREKLGHFNGSRRIEIFIQEGVENGVGTTPHQKLGCSQAKTHGLPASPSFRGSASRRGASRPQGHQALRSRVWVKLAHGRGGKPDVLLKVSRNGDLEKKKVSHI